MQNKNSINVFFLELLFAIFSFIIISTICLKVFAKAHWLNDVTRNSTYALEKMQNNIELFYSDVNNNTITADLTTYEYFDSNWNSILSYNDANFSMQKIYYHDESFRYLDISITNLDDNSILLEQSAKAFFDITEGK